MKKQKKDKPKILFLCHGGTIGMNLVNREGKLILVEPSNDAEFMAACEWSLKSFDGKINIVYEYMTSIDSTNVSFAHWQRLCHRIQQAKKEGYDGVTVTHGTNTLPHTTTAIALALAGTDPAKQSAMIPVVFTGAQNTIFATGGDGRFNLENLFRTVVAAIDCGSSDVLINFFDRVLLGCRTIKTNGRNFNAMETPAYPHVGWIDSRGVHLRDELLRVSAKGSANEIAAAWGPGVLSVRVSPGLEPTIIQDMLDTGRVQALILESLGEGSVCTEGAYSLINVIQRATDKLRIPVFISTQFAEGGASGGQDEIALDAVKAGAIPCFDHTAVATDVKVRWLIGNRLCATINDFRSAMRTSFAGEVTPPVED
jgi:L-asparaginase/Glu-tRNA(Gln) amidotransferase subunit D